MGTLVSVTIACRPSARTQAEAAALEVEQLLQTFGIDGWAWGQGALAGFNRQLASGAAVEVPLQLQPLFDHAWDLHLRSGGRFDPRVAQLVRLWGFDDVARLRSEPPAASAITTLMAALCDAPKYVRGQAYGPAPGIGWDFGGIAKGYIIDRALDTLRMRGCADATVDAGGNLAVRGSRGGAAWRIGIRDPRGADEHALLATLDARDEAVNTHGDDQRYFEYAGQRYAHILDPATGWPVQGLRSLTVVHADGTLAEAGGAALYVAGPQQWPALAARLGIDQVLVVTAEGRVQATEALARRLRAEPDVRIEIMPPAAEKTL